MAKLRDFIAPEAQDALLMAVEQTREATELLTSPGAVALYSRVAEQIEKIRQAMFSPQALAAYALAAEEIEKARTFIQGPEAAAIVDGLARYGELFRQDSTIGTRGDSYPDSATAQSADQMKLALVNAHWNIVENAEADRERFASLTEHMLVRAREISAAPGVTLLDAIEQQIQVNGMESVVGAEVAELVRDAARETEVAPGGGEQALSLSSTRLANPVFLMIFLVAANKLSTVPWALCVLVALTVAMQDTALRDRFRSDE